MTNAGETRQATAALLERYRAAKGRVVHILHSVPEGTPVFTPQTKLAEEFEELRAKDGEKVIEKIHPSAFAETGLHEYLRGMGAGKVVLVGYMVSFSFF